MDFDDDKDALEWEGEARCQLNPEVRITVSHRPTIDQLAVTVGTVTFTAGVACQCSSTVYSKAMN